MANYFGTGHGCGGIVLCSCEIIYSHCQHFSLSRFLFYCMQGTCFADVADIIANAELLFDLYSTFAGISLKLGYPASKQAI